MAKRSAGAITINIEAETKGLEKGLDGAKGSVKSFGDESEKSAKSTDTFNKGLGSVKGFLDGAFKVAVAGAVTGVVGLTGIMAGAGIASFNLSKDFQASQGVLQSELGITADESEKLNGIVEKVWGNNFGENVADVTSAIVETRKQIRGLADDELQMVTEGAIALRDAFGEDVGKSTMAVNVLMKKFGMTSEESLDMLASGFQNGLNNSGDFLDTVNEYGVIFGESGTSADEFFNILATGQQAGVLGIDKIADSFKELNGTILDGSPARKDALDAIGLNGDTFLADLASGKKSTMDAFNEIQAGLMGTEDKAVRNQSAVSLLGSMVEDFGFDSIAAISSVDDKWSENEGAIESVSKRYETFDTFVGGMWRKVLLQIKPFSDELLVMANSYVPQLETAIGNIGTGIQSVVDTGQALITFYEENKTWIDIIAIVVGSLVTSYYIVTGAVWLWTTAMTALTVAQMFFNGALAISPIGWAIIIIGALIAVGVLLWKNWDWISQKAGEVFNWISTTISNNWDWIKTKTGEAWDWVKAKTGGLWDWVVNKISGNFAWIVGIVTNNWNFIKNTFTNGQNAVKNGFGQAWRWMANKVEQGKNQIKSKVDNMLGKFTSIPGKIQGVFQKAANFASPLINMLKKVGDMASGLGGKVSGAVGKAKSFIPGFADGGFVGNTGANISRSNGDNRLITARDDEFVANQAQRDNLFEAIANGNFKGQSGGGQAQNIKIEIKAWDSQSLMDFIKKNAFTFLRALKLT